MRALPLPAAQNSHQVILLAVAAVVMEEVEAVVMEEAVVVMAGVRKYDNEETDDRGTS